MSNKWQYILILALLVCLILSLFWRSCSKTPEAVPVIVTDTIKVTDTLRLEGKTKIRYVTKTDTLIVVAHDTISDTIAVEIPIEHKEYRDTFGTDTSRVELGVFFEGYKAKIDSIELQYKFVVTPQVYEKKRDWRFAVMPSVQVGYGVAFGSPIVAAPYIGVGVAFGWGYTFKK